MVLCFVFLPFTSQNNLTAIPSPHAKVNQAVFYLQISNSHTTEGFTPFPSFQVKAAILCPSIIFHTAVPG